MSTIGLCALWAGLQATLLGLPIAVTCLLASRRGATAGAWSATLGLGVALVVGLAAFVPDRWLPMHSREIVNESRSHSFNTVSSGPMAEGAATTAGSVLRPGAILKLFSPAHERNEELFRPVRSWAYPVAWLMAAGWAFGLARLALGLVSLTLARRRAVRVEDEEWSTRLAELSASMGLTRHVELLQLDGLGTPATAGWRRPAIFLPLGWRGWTADERDAVLAHELGHIARGDYAAGLFGQFSLTFFFYHPLIHWLAARLRIEQELAADAIGARLAGGPAAYARHLSSLTLRLDGTSPSWHVRAFLPARGTSTLIRRIEMLRKNARTHEQPFSLLARGRAALPLMAAALALIALRGPAPATLAADAPAGLSIPELNQVPENSMGAIVVRPAALLAKPAMKDYAAQLNRRISTSVGIDPKTGKLVESKIRSLFKVEEVEWLSMAIDLSVGSKMLDGKPMRHLSMNGVTLRTTRPIDWAKIAKEFGIQCTEATESNKSFFIVKNWPNKEDRIQRWALAILDPQTILLDSEAGIRRRLARTAETAPTYVKKDEWDRVSAGPVAVILNSGQNKDPRLFEAREPGDAWTMTLLNGSERFLCRIDGSERFGFELTAIAKGDAEIEAMRNAVKARQDSLNSPDGVVQAANRPIDDALFGSLRKAAVETSGRTLSLRLKDVLPWKALLDDFLDEPNPPGR